MRKYVLVGGAVIACLSIVGVVETRRVDDLMERLRRIEEKPTADPRSVALVARDVGAVRESLRSAAGELRELIAQRQREVGLNQDVQRLDYELREAACALEEQERRLKRFEALEPEINPEALEQRFALMQSLTDAECQRLGATAVAAIDLARSTHAGLDAIEKDLTRDEDLLWRDLLGPTIQVMGEETVGSGVLLPPLTGADGRSVTHVLTAWHVVRDIPGLNDGSATQISVTVYEQDGHVQTEMARLLKHDAALDIAVLVLDVEKPLERGARLAARSRLSSVRTFDQVYAVGCPLGNDPIPTFGEIADTRHQVDGQEYWMISAPTYIGNSGGGVFDAQTHELIGIFTKIYTHGAVRPTVVPHMGLVTPLSKIYTWLESQNLAHLETPEAGSSAQPAAATR